jgi:hypothetical protein
MTESDLVVAVIVDMARSRKHVDRAALQSEFLDAFARVNDIAPALQPLEPTVGDEFQAVYADLAGSLRATLLARLFLPEGVECRFGLGLGEQRTVGTGVRGALQDGTAWWRARGAIDEARQHEYSKLGFVRTWYSDGGEPSATAGQPLVNAYLLGRDHIVGAMSPRSRRLLRGQLLGSTQGALAAEEGITQSAVSQNLARSGANALVAGEALLLGGAA